MLTLAFSCGDRPDNDTVASGPIVTTVAGTADGDSGDNADNGDNGSGQDGADTSDLLLDVGAGATGGMAEDGGNEDRCVGVDILFIIDNSMSMSDDQQAMTAAFPQFAEAMYDALPGGLDLHVGVTTTAGFWGGPNTENTFDCVSDFSDAELAEDYRPPEPGALGANGERGVLYEHEGQRFFQANTDDDPTLLSDWFVGAAQRGENGTNIEFMAAAAAWALDPVNAETNAGFLRDDGAVLVLFFITDEPDKSPAPISEFVDMVLAAKEQCGGADCVITSGAVPLTCYEHPNNTALFDFMNGFGKPPASVGFIPEGFVEPQPPQPEYSAILGEALATIIAETCDNIDPPK